MAHVVLVRNRNIAVTLNVQVCRRNTAFRRRQMSPLPRTNSCRHPRTSTMTSRQPLPVATWST